MAGALTAMIAAAFAGGVTPDPYFEYTTLLLPGSGTNGAQNNTFLDGSTNNFTITRNGNTTQGTFSPFSQTGWGNYFDGTGDYLTWGPGSGAAFGTSAFCVEMWFYPTGSIASIYLIDARNASQTNTWSLATGYSGTQSNIEWANNGTVIASGGTTNIISNTWNHIVYCRSGTGANQASMFINGVRQANVTDSTNYNVSPTISYVAARYSAANFLTGYLSNIRIVNGSQVYDPSLSTLTVPTAPLTAISGTSLLTCQSNRFIDNSTNNFTITVNGNTSVVAFSPFNPTASWSAATNGGSGYFDGNGDYLDVSSNAALGYGTGDFEISFWCYPISTDGYLIDQRTTAIQVAITIYYAGATIDVIINGASRISGTTLTKNAWHYVTLSRVSGVTKLFVDGSQLGSNYNDSNDYATLPMRIGCRFATITDIPYQGYISNFRVIKGTGVSSQTVPTAPLTAVSGTSLLLNFTNAGIYDATSKNDLETVGNAQISNAVTPQFGSTSIKFDGSGNYLYKTYDQLLNLLNGNFTIECWIYPTVTNTQMYFAGSANSSGSDNWLFGVTSSNKLYFNWVNTTPTGFAATSTASISQNVWTYVAAVKSGGTITLYINGSADGTSSPTGTYRNASFPFAVGRPGDYNGIYFTGYIQDFRMTTYARTITASPTAAFPTL